MDHALGAMFGMAYGDALGAETEFLNVASITRRFPPDGPHHLHGDPARVTDDTQMALAVGEALRAAQGDYSPATMEAALRVAFVAWMISPDNTRAPGITCMSACQGLHDGLPWEQATIAHSKGCGANMRVIPVGLIRGIAPDLRAALAQFQAALTHGHPTALAAADITSCTVAFLLAGTPPEDLLDRLAVYAEAQREIYHAAWLGSLWEQYRDYGGRHESATNIASATDYIRLGWDEVLAALERVRAAQATPQPAMDPCLATGEGWIAEEAFTTALHCFLLFPQDPARVIWRAATSSGDSDSIASIAGAFAGAHRGMAAWPGRWVDIIEYRARLESIAKTFY